MVVLPRLPLWYPLSHSAILLGLVILYPTHWSHVTFERSSVTCACAGWIAVAVRMRHRVGTYSFVMGYCPLWFLCRCDRRVPAGGVGEIKSKRDQAVFA